MVGAAHKSAVSCPSACTPTRQSKSAYHDRAHFGAPGVMCRHCEGLDLTYHDCVNRTRGDALHSNSLSDGRSLGSRRIIGWLGMRPQLV
jgi:hypothetical protein